MRSDAALDDALAACRREAAASGAEGGVFVEELIEGARHIEVQLLGDGEGGLIHLYERDCSVQRRRQKVVEEAPARGLSGDTRRRLLSHALEIGRACGYRSAGTVEFLLGEGERPVPRSWSLGREDFSRLAQAGGHLPRGSAYQSKHWRRPARALL